MNYFKEVKDSSRDATRRRAFTLVELLVVISIIGVLAALITGVAVVVLDKAAQTRVVADIHQVNLSMENYKNKYGSYPPNMSDANAMQRHFKSAFPRIHPDELLLINALSGVQATPTGTSIAITTPLPPYVAGLALRSDTSHNTVRAGNGAEAIAFWLGGFSNDPEHPISGPGGPWETIDNRSGLMDLDSSVLSDPTTARRVVFTVNGNAAEPASGKPYEIVLQTYSLEGLKEPYVYFDTSRGLPPTSPGWVAEGEKYPIYVSSEGAVARAYVRNTAGGGLEYVQPKSFQVLHAGTDDEWSLPQPVWSPTTLNLQWLSVNGTPIGAPPAYPTGPYIREMADNLTNFSTGTLEDSQEDE